MYSSCFINAPDDLYGPGVIRNGENIILVQGNDVEEIAHQVILLLGNKKLRQRIGRNGQRFVKEYLDWDITAEKTEKMYKEVLSTGQAEI